METNSTRMCELLVGLPDVNVNGVGDWPEMAADRGHKAIEPDQSHGDREVENAVGRQIGKGEDALLGRDLHCLPVCSPISSSNCWRSWKIALGLDPSQRMSFPGPSR